MNKLFFAFALFSSMAFRGQQTISGTFSPANEFTWLIAYRLGAGAQNYIADTEIKNGAFSLNIPQNAAPGTYRLVYAVPQEVYFFDVLYNGEEPLVLDFDAETGVAFINSEENKTLSAYLTEMQLAKQAIISFHADKKTNTDVLLGLYDGLLKVQQKYGEGTKGSMAHKFIEANYPYIPTKPEDFETYMANTKTHYFDQFSFNDPALQASAFLVDKATEFVFTALPVENLSQLEAEIAMQGNIRSLAEQLTGVDNGFKLYLLHHLWKQAAATELNALSDFIYNDYLKAIAVMANDQVRIAEIEVHNRLRIGAEAPEIVWKTNGETKKLGTLTGAEHYVLVFWSSTCGHCLNELPALHKKIAQNKRITVIAIGLEEEETNWTLEKAKLTGFEHALALGKWESDYATLYAIASTPRYFVLDRDKKIVFKPANDKELVAYLELH